MLLKGDNKAGVGDGSPCNKDNIAGPGVCLRAAWGLLLPVFFGGGWRVTHAGDSRAKGNTLSRPRNFLSHGAKRPPRRLSFTWTVISHARTHPYLTSVPKPHPHRHPHPHPKDNLHYVGGNLLIQEDTGGHLNNVMWCAAAAQSLGPTAGRTARDGCARVAS